MEYTSERITSLKPNEVFVFGSNLAGKHGGGAARVAMNRFGAVLGQGVGLQGQSYAIPTMQGGVKTIQPYVDEFIEFAKAHPELKFYVTRIGCGVAGFKDVEIAPLFIRALDKSNVVLPYDFVQVIKRCLGSDVPMKVTWNSNADFLEEYVKLKDAMKNEPKIYDRIKELRCKVFRNTVDIVNQGWYITEDGTTVQFESDEQMRKDSRLYSYEVIAHFAKDSEKPTEIDVVNQDCLEVAIDLLTRGFNPAVLNMASRRNPGGGVTTGAGAQEETLFRRTNLFRSLYQFAPYAEQYDLEKSLYQYPLHHDFGGVYTPDAVVFRESETRGYRLMNKPIKLSFISVAGLNRPQLINEESAIAPHLVYTIKNKIRTILAIGLEKNHHSLVLGALGCGAFRNPPKHIAYLFHEILNEAEFKNKYRRIVFAIIDDHNTCHSHNPKGNFLPFKEVFCDNIVNDPGYKVKSYYDYINSPEFDMANAHRLHSEYFGPHNNLKWTLLSNGILEISGNGAMPDYINHWHAYTGTGQAPWVGCKKYGIMPTRLIVREGITRIGENAFENFGCLKKVLLPNSLTSLGNEAFFDCFNIEMINIPVSIKLKDFGIAELPMFYQNHYKIVDNIMREK